MRKYLTYLLILLLATLLFQPLQIALTIKNVNPVVSEQKKAFTLDKDGNSYIVWIDNAGNDPCMMFVKWSNKGWINCKGEQYPEKSAQTCFKVPSLCTLMNPAIDIDSNGFPAISMIVGDGNLFYLHYVKWNGKEWTNINNAPYSLESTRVNNGLKFAHHPTLKLDSKDKPHIVWSQYEDDVPNISYIKWNGKEWVNAWNKAYPQYSPVICKTEKACKSPSMAIDSSDNPHVAWTESEPMGFSRIQYARWNGEKWVSYKDALFSNKGCEVSNSENSSYTPSLVLDDKDAPHMAFVSHAKGNIGICYIKLENRKWVNTLGKPYPKNSAFIAEKEYLNYRHYYQNPWLDLRDDGKPCVVWEGAGTDDENTIYYLSLEGKVWKNCFGDQYPCNADISKDCVSSNLPVIRICPKGRPNVVWIGHKTGNQTCVCFIRWDGAIWVNAFGQPYPKNTGSIED